MPGAEDGGGTKAKVLAPHKLVFCECGARDKDNEQCTGTSTSTMYQSTWQGGKGAMLKEERVGET